VESFGAWLKPAFGARNFRAPSKVPNEPSKRVFARCSVLLGTISNAPARFACSLGISTGGVLLGLGARLQFFLSKSEKIVWVLKKCIGTYHFPPLKWALLVTRDAARHFYRLACSVRLLARQLPQQVCSVRLLARQHWRFLHVARSVARHKSRAERGTLVKTSWAEEAVCRQLMHVIKTESRPL